MRLSVFANGVTHHVVNAWTYAGKLDGILACGTACPSYADLFEIPATCLRCAISPHSACDTAFVNEDA